MKAHRSCRKQLTEQLQSNVTDHKQTEEEIRKHRDQLEDLVDEKTKDIQKVNEELRKEITERKQSEKKREDLAKFPSENPNPVLRIAKDGEVLYSNQAGELLLSKWKSGIGKTVPEKWRNLIAQTFVSGKGTEEEVEGKIFSIVIAPVEDAGYVNLYAIDITERKRAEEALQTAHDELETKVSERTEELSQANIRLQELDKLKSMFIASMSHELRTPLNSIIGFTGIVLKGMSGELTGDQRWQLTMAKTSADHLLNLINDVIDVSKIEAGMVDLDIEQFDLSALVQDVKKLLKTVADEQGLGITLEMPERLVVTSDERRTKQIIINFVNNAIKFTDKGRIVIKMSEKDNKAEVSVVDTGIGIKKEDMSKLFWVFSRIRTENRLTEGSGLGLYLSKKIADLLGGALKAESEFGKGSTFTFTLPLKYKEPDREQSQR